MLKDIRYPLYGLIAAMALYGAASFARDIGLSMSPALSEPLKPQWVRTEPRPMTCATSEHAAPFDGGVAVTVRVHCEMETP